MVERYLDKKIRILRGILEATPNERIDSKGKKHPCKHLETDSINMPSKLLAKVLSELKLTVSNKTNFGELFGIGDTDDYLFEIIVEDEDEKRLSILLKECENKYPKRQKPIIREKTLELIARKIGDLDSGYNLVKFLRSCGVDEELIIYPNTKWRMIYDAMVYLTNSRKKEDEDVLSKIIGEATHPLMHNGDSSSAEILRKEFNGYLSYDHMGIAYDEKNGTYLALQNLEGHDVDVILFEEQKEFEEKEQKQLEFLSLPQNRESISLLKKTYQSLINVIEVFCENPSHPTSELNDAYQFLNKLVWELIRNLGLRGDVIRNFNNYASPFVNLFSAEKHYQEQKRELSWQKIRPEMNAMYGDIEELYQEVNGSDVIAEPDKQKKLNEIQLHLSTLKKKKEIARKMQIHDKTQSIPTTKIEITEMPELRIKGFEEKIILQKPKNKIIQLRKFPKDLRWEEITIQFLNEHEVIVKARNETLQTTYELLGFQDEKKKLPNKQWQFLRLLAIKNGEISWKNNHNLSLKQINSIKKQKQLLSEALKACFQIYESEPFHDYKTEKSYRIKLILTPESGLNDIDEQEVYNNE